MTNQPVIESLEKLLASTYSLYLKTQNYHWNVEGLQFKALHEMFEEHYTELAAAIDEIAERIRSLGAKAPGSYNAFARLSQLQEATGEEKALEMVAILLKDHQTLAALCKHVELAASQADDSVTEDMAIVRTEVHQKTAWMLQSTLAG